MSCRGLINHQTYLSQKVPTLYTALSAPDTDVTNPAIYGVASNPFVVGPNEVVEIVLNNLDFGGHPWHLHGHQFQTVARSRPHAGLYDPNNPGTLPSVPMRRDTVNVLPGGNIALRFKSGNPGVFLFHCRKSLILPCSRQPN
jgi:iron transport multicopper oxidase